MKKCTLIIEDEVNCKFDNLDASIRHKIVDKLKFFMPYAYHVPAYKLGRWDGMKHFASINGRTQLNLITEDIISLITNAGYEIDIQDKRKQYNFNFEPIEEDFLFKKFNITWPKNHPSEGEPILLRDYQLEIINTFLENNQGIIQAPTGSGKTIVSATLSTIVEPYGRTIVIVPSKSLVVQTEADYKLLGLDVGVFFGERKEIDKTHTICTWQSLESLNKLGKKLPIHQQPIMTFLKDVVAVMVDESHSAKASVLYDLLTGPFSNCPIRWGLTGTIPKEKYDYYSLIGGLGPILKEMQASDLQEKGVLAQCHVNILQLIDTVEYDNYADEHSYLVTDQTRLDFIVKQIEKIGKSGNTLVLIDRIEGGKYLASNIKDSIFIYGSTSLNDRKDQYDEIQESTNKILIASYGVAAVGINIPRIFNLVLLEPGKSFVRIIQSIGRGIRKAKDKDFVMIYDICSSLKFSKRHLTKRKSLYKEAKYPFTLKKINRFTEME